MKLTILASGNGTNLQNIINHIDKGVLKEVSVIKIITDKICKALEIADHHNIEKQYIPKGKNFNQELLASIPKETDYIVLAGFLSILSDEFCQTWKQKIINIHPSLLPKYGGKGMYGKHVHQAVIDHKETESGATVHYVTTGIDEGEIILQKSLKIKKGENADWLAVKVHQIEYEILIEALQQLSKKH